MAANLIPASVISQCMNLSLEQVSATIKSGGAEAVLKSAEFIGMTTSGIFVYKCSGEYFRPNYSTDTLDPHPWPAHLAEFRIIVKHNKKFLLDWKPEFRDEAEKRLIDGEFALYWK